MYRLRSCNIGGDIISYQGSIPSIKTVGLYRPVTKYVIVDIDRTIANCWERAQLATDKTSTHMVNTEDWFNAFMDGQKYWMDKPIEKARFYLHLMMDNFAVFYLSGRRESTSEETKAWLNIHNFPTGQLFQRRPGSEVYSFKMKQISELQNVNYNIIAGYGDDSTDMVAYQQHGIFPIEVDVHGKGWRMPPMEVCTECKCFDCETIVPHEADQDGYCHICSTHLFIDDHVEHEEAEVAA